MQARSSRSVVLVFAGAVAAVAGGCLGPDAERSVVVEPPAAVIPAPPKPIAPDLSLAPGHELRRPIENGRLAIIPIVATASVPDRRYVALADGMRSGAVEVRISETYSLDLAVHNRGADPVAIMDGELVLEGRQDRVMGAAVIEPGETKIVVAHCVEEHRATGGDVYSPTGLVAYPELRRRARSGYQPSVWDQVDISNAHLRLAPPTGSYRGAAAKLDKAARVRRDELVTAVAALPDADRVVGVAVAIDGRMVAIDRFATPGLWAQVAPMLLGSYVVGEAFAGPMETTVEGRPATRQVTPDDVRAFQAQTAAGAIETTAASVAILTPYVPPAYSAERAFVDPP